VTGKPERLRISLNTCVFFMGQVSNSMRSGFFVLYATDERKRTMEWLKQFTDYGITGILAFMSVVALGIAIERKLYYRTVKPDDFQCLRSLELAMTRKLHIIATIGSNAPYIGLLGTVTGIMVTFASIGEEGIADAGKIMVGLALALKATAIGLVVAIPAVASYNFLLRAVKEKIMEWEISHG